MREQAKGAPGLQKKKASAVETSKATPLAEDARLRGSRPTNQSRGKPATSRTYAPVPAVIERAQDMGLMAAGTQQVGARLPTKLLAQAKKRTGITSTTDLLTFALANVAIEDNFATAFVAARGKLAPDLDVGF